MEKRQYYCCVHGLSPRTAHKLNFDDPACWCIKCHYAKKLVRDENNCLVDVDCDNDFGLTYFVG